MAVFQSLGSSKESKGHSVHLSKALSWILRHGAVKEGLPIDAHGFIPITTILGHKTFSKYTQSDILSVVQTDTKQRFMIGEHSPSGVAAIRANQGHSTSMAEAVSDLDLKLITPEEAASVTAIHGTTQSRLGNIKASGGLNRMGRVHVHMAPGLPADGEVISGMRRSCDVSIYIDVAAAMGDGLVFYRSSNGVILCPGDGRGFIDVKYFSKVINHNR